MAILNVTPDSFSESGTYFRHADAVLAAQRMKEDGADLIDVGGESTRPGATEVSVEEEIRRVVPVIESIVSLGLPISIDTRKSEVALEALKAGAVIVNDVSGLSDPRMVEVCLEEQATICLMHMKGTPQTMQKEAHYSDLVAEVRDFLLNRATGLVKIGIDPKRIWLDPGIGFAKTAHDNFKILNELSQFVELGYPILIGVSRKSFIGALSGANAESRLPGTLAAQVLAQASGARIIRAHDVAQARQAIDITATILKPSLFSKHLA